jgi:hypothetical protein
MCPSKDDDKKRDEVLKRMLHTPHKPHVPKKKSKELLSESSKKKGDAPIAKKKRRPQGA